MRSPKNEQQYYTFMALSMPGATMQHVILGQGNLGQALNRAVYRKTGTSPIVFHRTPIESIEIKDSKDVWIWNTEGFGSVGECKKDPKGAFECHVQRVHDLIHKFPESNLVCFSTNYVAESRVSDNHSRNLGSHYAVTKAMMEELIRLEHKFKQNLWAIRVANLYSKYKPWDSFAGRLLKAQQNGNTISLPASLMIPTETDWLADQLMKRFESLRYYEPIIGLAPGCSISTNDFGRFILGRELPLSMDTERPMNALIKNSFINDPVTETWFDVFNQAREYRSQLGLQEYVPPLD
jgi:hypothetical protein